MVAFRFLSLASVILAWDTASAFINHAPKVALVGFSLRPSFFALRSDEDRQTDGGFQNIAPGKESSALNTEKFFEDMDQELSALKPSSSSSVAMSGPSYDATTRKPFEAEPRIQALAERSNHLAAKYAGEIAELRSPTTQKKRLTTSKSKKTADVKPPAIAMLSFIVVLASISSAFGLQ